ncbi:MAG: mitofilin family membrane protein, partial [Rhodospirillaceae bacterium]|nr:mitofilin family membrane protein [Rhodospirillaceae bacterium]
RARGWVWVSAAVIAGFVVLAALATIPAWSPWTDDTPTSSTGTFSDSDGDAATAETTTADDTSSDTAADAASESDADASAASETDTTSTAVDTPDGTGTDSAGAVTTGNEGTAASSATAGNDTLETLPFAPAGLPEVGEPVEEQVAAVDEPVATLESQAATTPSVDGAEAGAPSTADPANTADIAALAERVTGIEQLLIDFMTEVPAQSLADVKAEVQRLIDENEGLRNQLTILTDRFEQSDATAFMLAVGRLGAALNEGRPFAPELDTLNKLASADPQLASASPALEALAPHAATGAPSEIRLVAWFPETARAIVQAAQQDSASGIVDAEEGGWFDRLIGRITDLVTVRPVGAEVEGDSPAAHVARAEAHLQTGDLESAVVELELLTGAPAEAAAAWLTDAKARLAVEPAFRTLDQLALERLGTGSADADTAAGG